MKISGKQLEKIIKEEVSRYLRENDPADAAPAADAQQQPANSKEKESPESIKKRVDSVIEKFEAAPGLDSSIAQMGSSTDAAYLLLKYMVQKMGKRVSAQNKILAIKRLYDASKEIADTQ